MPNIDFYFEYRDSQRVHLPVNPEELQIEAPGQNETISVVNLGHTSILKTPGLKKLSFESFIPVENRGSYVQANAEISAPDFYRNYFEAIQAQKEPVNLIVTGLSIFMRVSIEDFSYYWKGSDPDMYFKLTLKEYRKSNIQITNTGADTSATPATPARENTARQVVIGSQVRVNGQLHRDSYGNGPGAVEQDAIRRVNFIKNGRSHPYHITTLDGGWRGWVTAESVEVIS